MSSKEGHFNQCPTRSGLPVSDITGFRALKQTTTGTEDIKFDVAGASDGATCLGIAIGDALTDEAVGCAFSGPGVAEVDGSGTAIAAGDFLKPGANGILVKAVAGDDYIFIAMEPATAANLVIRGVIAKGQLDSIA